jgi:hypothetical protein
MEAVSIKLLNHWFSYSVSNENLKKGRENEPIVLQRITKRKMPTPMNIFTIFSSGLLESKINKFIGVSPDGICYINDAKDPCLVEIKTVLTGDIAEWMAASEDIEASVGSDAWYKMVKNEHKC